MKPNKGNKRHERHTGNPSPRRAGFYWTSPLTRREKIKRTSTGFSILFAVCSFAQAGIQLPVPAAAAQVPVAIGDTITSGTEGSVNFLGASGVLAQDNTNFFWNNTSDRLGIRANGAPGYDFTIGHSNAEADPTISLESRFGTRDHYILSRVFGSTEGSLRWKHYSGGGDPARFIVGFGAGHYNFSATGLGVQNINPVRPLHVTGAMRMDPQASAPGTPASGDFYVDSTPDPDEWCFYDGAAWQAFSGTDANCS